MFVFSARKVEKFEKPITCNFVRDQCYLKLIVYEDTAMVSENIFINQDVIVTFLYERYPFYLRTKFPSMINRNTT